MLKNGVFLTDMIFKWFQSFEIKKYDIMMVEEA
jgi:hypothetical protein